MTSGRDRGNIFPGQRGVYLVSAFHGTQYRVDLDELTVRRSPNPNDPDSEKDLRKDVETRPQLAFEPIRIGDGMTLILDIRGDGSPTWRRTSTVIRLERLT